MLSLNFTDCIDVSNDGTIAEKISHMLEAENVLAMIEEYEYKKPYRHFCYFKISSIKIEKIQDLVNNGKVNVFDKKVQKPFDDATKPTIYLVGETIYFKRSRILHNDNSDIIKYVVVAVIDKKNDILEIRLDKVGRAYKNSHLFYKDIIDEILLYLKDSIELAVEHIDFKAVVEFVKSERDDITIVAQRMTRNGNTAYLETYDEEDSIIPIIGELDKFIEDEDELFNKDDNTRAIKSKLQEFRRQIEEKSDMPFVKIIMNESRIKFGITHTYKGREYSLFMLYGELIGEEMMSSVKEYIMQCYKDFRTAISPDAVSNEEM